jgi:hypothetical protein
VNSKCVVGITLSLWRMVQVGPIVDLSWTDIFYRKWSRTNILLWNRWWPHQEEWSTNLVEREYWYSCIVNSKYVVGITLSLWRMVQVGQIVDLSWTDIFYRKWSRTDILLWNRWWPHQDEWSTNLVEREHWYSCIVDSQCVVGITLSLWRMVQVGYIVDLSWTDIFYRKWSRTNIFLWNRWWPHQDEWSTPYGTNGDLIREVGTWIKLSCGTYGDLIKMNGPPPMAQMVTWLRRFVHDWNSLVVQMVNWSRWIVRPLWHEWWPDKGGWYRTGIFSMSHMVT